MDAAKALADLTEISSQIEAAAIADDRGRLVAATRADGDALAAAGHALLERAERVQGRRPVQVDVSTAGGSVFVVRENGLTIVGTTPPEPTSGLVLYDLTTCLRSLERPRAKGERTKGKAHDDEA